MHFILLVLLLGVTMAGTDFVQAQEQPQGSVRAEVEVSLIGLYASVRDSKDRPVKGLKKEDFVLTDKGKPLEIAQFSGDPAEAASVAFLLDTSGSMRVGEKYDAAERLVDAVLEKLEADDEASLITFADEKVQTLVDAYKRQSASLQQAGRSEALGPHGPLGRNRIQPETGNPELRQKGDCPDIGWI